MSVPGLHREEVASKIGEALRDTEPYKYSRTKIRGIADLIIHVAPGAYGGILPGPGKVAAIITPADVPKLHQTILDSFSFAENTGETKKAGG